MKLLKILGKITGFHGILKIFTRSWNVKYTTSSTGYPESSDCTEKTVNTFKTHYRKTIKCKVDPILAIIEFDATPKQNLTFLAEMLTERRHRTLFPVPMILLTPTFKTKEKIKTLEQNKKE